MSAQSLTLGVIQIRQHNGLYCLNDIHRASGGAEKHRPIEYLRLDSTQTLIETLIKELSFSNVRNINEAGNPASNSTDRQSKNIIKGGDSHLFLRTLKGRNGGTYACKELVIAYAGWINAAFHLRVLRVFLESLNPPKKPRVIRDENWKRQRHHAAISYQIMSTMLEMAREHHGKQTKTHHYSNEARLINWALSGEFSAVDRQNLPLPQLDMLAKLEIKNTQLIALGRSYAQRKTHLAEWAARLCPQLSLPTD